MGVSQKYGCRFPDSNHPFYIILGTVFQSKVVPSMCIYIPYIFGNMSYFDIVFHMYIHAYHDTVVHFWWTFCCSWWIIFVTRSLRSMSVGLSVLLGCVEMTIHLVMGSRWNKGRGNCWWLGNPAPVDMVNIPLFIGFHTSQVDMQDFSHQPKLLYNLGKNDDLVDFLAYCEKGIVPNFVHTLYLQK